MSAMKKTKKIALGRIFEDSSIQPRFQKSRDAVMRYAQIYRSDPRKLPAVTLARIGTRDRLVLIDGFHRVDAARIARLGELPAVIIEAATEDEARWLAVEANIANGVPISRAEKRIVFRRFVRAGKNVKADGSLMSSREIERTLTVGRYQTMLNWMKDDFPLIHSMMTGEEPEEPEPESDLGSRKEDQALLSVEWTQSEYLSAIKKAVRDVPPERIVPSVANIQRDVESALQVTSLEELLEAAEEPTDF